MLMELQSNRYYNCMFFLLQSILQFYLCRSNQNAMDTNIFKQFSDIPTKEIAPGYFSKIIHTENNSINFIEVAAGKEVPRHQHPHHQCAFVIEGRFELTVNDIPQILDANTFAL